MRKKGMHKGKKQDIGKLRARERAILESFLGDLPVTRLISPNFEWADIIPERLEVPATVDVTALDDVGQR